MRAPVTRPPASASRWPLRTPMHIPAVSPTACVRPTSIDDLDLDGALVVRVGAGCSVHIQRLVVQNRGWELEPTDTDPKVAPEYAVRG